MVDTKDSKVLAETLSTLKYILWEAQQNRKANNEIIKLLQEARYYVKPKYSLGDDDILNASTNGYENFAVLTPTGMQFGEETRLVRDIPRPMEFRQENYNDLYDFNTFFYEAILVEDELILVAPSLFNFKTLLPVSEFTIDGEVLQAYTIFEEKRTSRIHFDLSNITLGLQPTLNIQIGKINTKLQLKPSYNDKLKDEVILYGTVFNNKLQWVHDWVQYYVNMHEVTAVVLFDNGSTNYTPFELLNSVRDIKGLKYAYINSNHYKFGPLSINRDPNWWDSDFYKIGTLETMRWKFGQKAKAIIQADIDELVVIDSGETLVERLERSEEKGLHYSGIMVPPVIDTVPDDSHLYVYTDFKYVDDPIRKGVPKWTVRPDVISKSGFFRDHWVGQGRLEKASDVHLYHFEGVNNAYWGKDDLSGRNRTIIQKDDHDNYKVDKLLLAALQKGFGI